MTPLRGSQHFWDNKKLWLLLSEGAREGFGGEIFVGFFLFYFLEFCRVLDGNWALDS